jgi:hypothetical protein
MVMQDTILVGCMTSNMDLTILDGHGVTPVDINK